MLELIGTVAGVLSLCLAVLLEWDNIKARLAGLRRQPEQAVRRESPSARVSAAAPAVEMRPSAAEEVPSKPRGAIPMLLGLLKAIVSVLLGGFIVSVAVGFVLEDFFGLSVGMATYDLGVTFSLIAGVLLGAVFLRKRSWAFLLAFGGFGFILLSVLVMISPYES